MKEVYDDILLAFYEYSLYILTLEELNQRFIDACNEENNMLLHIPIFEEWYVDIEWQNA